MSKNYEEFIREYESHKSERAAQGIPPLALNVAQTQCVIDMCKDSGLSTEQKTFAKELLIHRVNPGVDASAQLKAAFLGEILLTNKQV